MYTTRLNFTTGSTQVLNLLFQFIVEEEYLCNQQDNFLLALPCIFLFRRIKSEPIEIVGPLNTALCKNKPLRIHHELSFLDFDLNLIRCRGAAFLR